MQRLINASLIGLTLLLTGCEGEPEDTPDITEAIPLDVDGDDGQLNAEEGGETNPVETPPPPSSVAGSEATNYRELPEAMEKGSNPPGMTTPPAGSKVQRLN